MRSTYLLVALTILLLPCVLAFNFTEAANEFPVGSDWLQGLGLNEEALIANAQQQLFVRRGSLGSTVASDSGCCECAGKVAKHIIESTIEEVASACQNVTCPILQKYCKYFEEHEDRYAGYLSARIHPASLGFSYCMGTGECQHPNVTTLQDELFAQRRDDLALLQVPAVSRLMDQTSSLDSSVLLGESDEVAGDSKKHKCESKAVKYVMKHIAKDIKKACKETECPKLREICKWAKEHHEYVRGYIYGRVEPWKFAIGYCSNRDSKHVANE